MKDQSTVLIEVPHQTSAIVTIITKQQMFDMAIDIYRSWPDDGQKQDCFELPQELEDIDMDHACEIINHDNHSGYWINATSISIQSMLNVMRREHPHQWVAIASGLEAALREV